MRYVSDKITLSIYDFTLKESSFDSGLALQPRSSKSTGRLLAFFFHTTCVVKKPI